MGRKPRGADPVTFPTQDSVTLTSQIHPVINMGLARETYLPEKRGMGEVGECYLLLSNTLLTLKPPKTFALSRFLH